MWYKKEDYEFLDRAKAFLSEQRKKAEESLDSSLGPLLQMKVEQILIERIEYSKRDNAGYSYEAFLFMGAIWCIKTDVVLDFSELYFWMNEAEKEPIPL